MARKLSSATDRWAGIGPYYAMFPVDFADTVVNALTAPSDRVLDPFAGRATSLFSAAAQGRFAAGVEINAVGWVYGQAKLRPAPQSAVEARVVQIAQEARESSDGTLESLPQFFRRCYARRVLKFLLTARQVLKWRENQTDWTTMAFILVYLHGKRESNLSNQMRQTKAMAPDYSIRWWTERGLKPPDRDPQEFLLERVRWRYAKGKPESTRTTLLLGDSCHLLNGLRRLGLFDLLLTSPPYYGVTNYHYDQWLRLWMLGGSPYPAAAHDPHKRKFESRKDYQELLRSVFGQASEMMKSSGCVYVRTDAREFTFATTLEVLRDVFPTWWNLQMFHRPFARPTQTALFGDASSKPGEVDIVLSARHASLPQWLLEDGS